MEYLDRVGLSDRASHKPAELSGGQSQRVAIARALITQPALLLADEPTGALDTQTSAQIMEIFREVNADGMTVVLVTHEPEIAQQTHRSIQLRDGQIIADEKHGKSVHQPTEVTTDKHNDEPRSPGKYQELSGDEFISDEHQK